MMESKSQQETTDELARLSAQVSDYEQKLADAATLVARIRHEINNPLAALLGQAQLLLREELTERSRKDDRSSSPATPGRGQPSVRG